mmetsp:Transcript_27759/g.38614  ORF Transcript_27759/g.38614 Transcript_27759/m.38614 type:complete len:208 (+) Transcript_27759:44-667(+)
MSSWWRGNNSDDEKICNQSRQVVSKCYIKDGKRVCHKETKLVRHCPGEPPQVVESIKEEEEQELGTGGAGSQHHEPDFGFPQGIHEMFDEMNKMTRIFSPFGQFFEDEGSHHHHQQQPEQDSSFFQHFFQQEPRSFQQEPPSSFQRDGREEMDDDPFVMWRKKREQRDVREGGGGPVVENHPRRSAGGRGIGGAPNRFDDDSHAESI